jgi:hypothetical protein
MIKNNKPNQSLQRVGFLNCEVVPRVEAVPRFGTVARLLTMVLYVTLSGKTPALSL